MGEMCIICGQLLRYDATYFDNGDCICPGCEVDDGEFDFDCAMGSDGQCGKAGSEECDWECPFNREATTPGHQP